MKKTNERLVALATLIAMLNLVGCNTPNLPGCNTPNSPVNKETDPYTESYAEYIDPIFVNGKPQAPVGYTLITYEDKNGNTQYICEKNCAKSYTVVEESAEESSYSLK